MPPSTGHDMVEDIQDLFRFVAFSLNDRLDEMFSNQATLSNWSPFRVDPEAIGVSGTSAGPLCAYLACMHAVPKPKVVLSLYGRGGDLLVRDNGPFTDSPHTIQLDFPLLHAQVRAHPFWHENARP